MWAPGHRAVHGDGESYWGPSSSVPLVKSDKPVEKAPMGLALGYVRQPPPTDAISRGRWEPAPGPPIYG